MSKVNNVNSWNGWDPLEQVILGNCYNPSFFDGVKDSQTRDLLQQLLYETQEDLSNIKRQLEMAGVDVVQIEEGTATDGNIYSSFEDCKIVDNPRHGKLGMLAPLIAPRDYMITLGNKVVCSEPWEQINTTLKGYFSNPDVEFDDTLYQLYKNNNEKIKFAAPYITRFGNKLVIDDNDCRILPEFILRNYPEFEQAVHTCGGHNDGVFAPLKPGHVLSTRWLEQIDYDQTIPGWDVCYIKDINPTEMGDEADQKFYSIMDHKNDIDTKTWWSPQADNNPKFCDFVGTYLNEWTGWAMESIFEVNVLVINPELVFCINYDKEAFDYFDKIGMEAVIVPFRHRHFWDSGLHCLTVDTRRNGTKQNYWS